MSLFALANRKPNKDSGKKIVNNWFVIFEAVAVTFLITLTAKLIELRHIPTSIDEVWLPFLVSFLMALYAYARARGIEAEDV